MTPLTPADLDRFARQFRWPGGRLRRVALRHRRGQLDVDVVVAVTTALKDLAAGARRAKLRLRFVDVSECRFQKRNGSVVGKLGDVRFGFLDGRFFAGFDGLGLSPGEKPALHDFRGSDIYFGSRDLLWQELPERKA